MDTEDSKQCLTMCGLHCMRQMLFKSHIENVYKSLSITRSSSEFDSINWTSSNELEHNISFLLILSNVIDTESHAHTHAYTPTCTTSALWGSSLIFFQCAIWPFIVWIEMNAILFVNMSFRHNNNRLWCHCPGHCSIICRISSEQLGWIAVDKIWCILIYNNSNVS